jgi:predicted Rossmann-fold nucleotide-binding protein
MGEGRNILVVRFADAVIAVGGEWGTLSEIALARRIGTPVILLAPALARGLSIDVARDADHAVDWAIEHARTRAG